MPWGMSIDPVGPPPKYLTWCQFCLYWQIKPLRSGSGNKKVMERNALLEYKDVIGSSGAGGQAHIGRPRSNLVGTFRAPAKAPLTWFAKRRNNDASGR